MRPPFRLASGVQQAPHVKIQLGALDEANRSSKALLARDVDWVTDIVGHGFKQVVRFANESCTRVEFVGLLEQASAPANRVVTKPIDLVLEIEFPSDNGSARAQRGRVDPDYLSTRRAHQVACQTADGIGNGSWTFLGWNCKRHLQGSSRVHDDSEVLDPRGATAAHELVS
jgi:hypothetical protein